MNEAVSLLSPCRYIFRATDHIATVSEVSLKAVSLYNPCPRTTKYGFRGGGGVSLFENENLAIFAGNSQKDSLINYSKIAKKYSLFRSMTLLQPQIVQL